MRLDESISNDIIKDVLKKILETIDDIKADFSWEGLFVTHTIEELLWGYEDPLLKELKRLPFIKSMVPSPFFSLYVSPGLSACMSMSLFLLVVFVSGSSSRCLLFRLHMHEDVYMYW